jgi:hypothetical protein
MPKCKHCKAPYERTRNGIETWCSVECGYQLARLKQAQAFKKETRAMRKKLNESSVKWWADKAKTVCHDYIKKRDKLKGCISCGTIADVQYAAGHFIPSGRASALRYDERNIFKQCNNYCNKNMSGNVRLYRMALVRDYGEEYVQELERIGHTKKTWKIPELQEVIEYYKRKLKELNV